MRTTFDVAATPDGMAKATVKCGLRERVVWLGPGRRYKVDPLPGDDARSSRLADQVGRTCVLVDVLQDRGSRKVRVRWDDTGRTGMISPCDIVLLASDDGPTRPVAGRGVRMAKSRMARGRALDRHEDNVAENVGHMLEKTAKYADADRFIGKVEGRADKRRLCEMCQRVHVSGRMHRACRFCWTKEGCPDSDLLNERLNALAYERHVKGIPERWRT